MTAFNYVAINAQGQTIKGAKEADNPRSLRQQLRQQGLTPLEIQPINHKKSTVRRYFGLRQKSIKLKDLCLLTQQLATLVEAGLPLEEALQGVIEQTEKNTVKSILTGVRAKVMEGHTLAYALEQFPQAFSELYCATIAAGEHTGKLHVVLVSLAEYSERQQHMRQKVSQALIYPVLMMLVSFAIVTFLLLYVVPNIIQVFTETGQTLPTATAILLNLSHGLQHYGIYLLFIFILAGMGFWRLRKQRAFLRRWQQWQLKLPLLGNGIRTVNTARYARTFGILFAAGVSVIEAMQVASRLITNLPMAEAITEAGNKVKEGLAIHKALKQTHYFSPMAIHLIASGESSGRLEHMLQKTADNQERDVTRVIDTLLTLLEPMIILLMGGIVMFIVLAILLPIFQMDQIVG